jgi:hypothetical protein
VVHKGKYINFISRTRYKDVLKKVLIGTFENERPKYDSYRISDMIKANRISDMIKANTNSLTK